MRIGADQRVGIGVGAICRLVRHDDARQILEVHLMDDAGVGRDDAKVAERVLPPSQERVSLLVSRKLELSVQLKRVRLGEVVDLHRMVDDELNGL